MSSSGTTIPASTIVRVTPNVLTAGGAALALIGLFLTTSTRIPIGSVPSFPDAPSVEAYFGGGSDEANAASIYFKGFENSNLKPGALRLAQYPQSAVAAYLRSAALGLTLVELQALNGTVIVTVNGSVQNASVNFSTAVSFSSAATLLETALNLQTAFTGVIAANVAVARIDPVTGTAAIAGTTMTVSATTHGGYAAGQTITGIGVVSNTKIVSQLTGGTAGGTGTYQVSVAQTVGSTAISAPGAGVMTVSGITTGTLAVGQTLTGSGVTASTAIVTALTGTGGVGTYAVSPSQTVAPSTTITANGGTLTVSAISAGSVGVGDIVVGSGVTAGNRVTAPLTGTGGNGTYLVSVGDIVGSEAMTISGGNVAVTYDSVSTAFIIVSGTTGATSTMTYATGTLAASLGLTAATGAVLSQGADATTPGTFMDGIVAVTQNWVSFMTIFDPDVSGYANKLAFAAWANDQGDVFTYVGWDPSLTAQQSAPAVDSFPYQVTKVFAYSGTQPISTPTYEKAAFDCSIPACLNITQKDGRTTFFARTQSGLEPDVTNATVAANLIANGANFYGVYANGANQWIWYAPGSISGKFRWADSFINQVAMNSAFQTAMMFLMQAMRSIPYNATGRGFIEAALADPIIVFLNFGAIVAGIELSSAQASEVNNAAGLDIATTIQNQGWYLQVKPATADVRIARGSPPCTFWYQDGEAVQSIDLDSIVIQ